MKDTKRPLAIVLCIAMIIAMSVPAMASGTIDSASSWAKEGITSAVAKGFVPTDIQGGYTNVITRQEFCRMAIKWLEYATGKSIDTLLSEKGLSRNPNAFTDTGDPDILAAFALGITSGAGNNLFSPNGQFSREQAATMIMNTCKAAGMDISNTKDAGFKDIGGASSWAVNGINFVRNAGIMGGTGNDNFSPKTAYSREQSIITFNNIKYGNSPGAGQPQQNGSTGTVTQGSTLLTIDYYMENPDIPDFGVFAGIELRERAVYDGGMIGYAYDNVPLDSKIDEYEKAIITAGYQLKASRTTSGGLPMRTYSKGSKVVMLGAGNGSLAVILVDATTAIKTYDKFPTVPDFEFFVADILVSREEEGDAQGMLYTYHCNGPEASDLMMKYGAMLVQAYGWESKGIYSESAPGWYFTKGSMEIMLSSPTTAGLNRTVYVIVTDNSAASSGYWEKADTEQDRPITEEEFNAWLLGKANFSDTQIYNYMQKQAANSPSADQTKTTFTLTDTMRKPTASGNVYTAPMELISQSVGYVNITNPDKVRYGCTIQVTSGRNSLTGLWNSYTIDEDGIPGGTAYTVVDATVID